MQNTNIEWTDHTLNFWWGCTKVSPACQHCYAEQVAKVFGKRLFGTVPEWGAGKPRFQRLEAARKEALALNKRAAKAAQKWDLETAGYLSRGSAHPSPKPLRPRVFVNSMSDWLDDEVPIEWLAHLLETLHLCPNLDFQLLTKRPENMPDRLMLAQRAGITDDGAVFDWLTLNHPPPNLWIGTTVEDQTRAYQRIPSLLQVPAKIRFLSCEPLLDPVSLSHLLPLSQSAPGIHWVIAGGESGSQARPTHPDWFRSLRDQCTAARVPFFFKQWGEWISVDNIKHCTSEKARLDKGFPGHKHPDGTLMLRLGTDHTGRKLDGHLHAAFPQV